MRHGLLSAALLLVFGTAHAGETMRCGRWVVDESATVEELLEKCGEPASKRFHEEEIRARNPDGTTRTVGTTVTEYWTYDRGSRSFPMLVTVVDGKLRSIERAR